MLAVEALEQRLLFSVSWGNPAGGDWDVAGNWVGGRVPGPGDDVLINGLNAGAGVTHGQNTTDAVHSITAAAPVTLSGGTLSVAGTFSDSSAVSLAGGTLGGAAVASGTTIDATGGAIRGIILNGTLNDNGNLAVLGTLALNGTLTPGLGAFLVFEDAAAGDNQQVTGGGTLNLGFASFLLQNGSAHTVTFGHGITVAGSGGTLGLNYYLSGGTWVNDGLLTTSAGGISLQEGNSYVNQSDGTWDAGGGSFRLAGTCTNDGLWEVTGGTLSLAGAWTNRGTIAVRSGTLDLGGTFTTADIGTVTSSGTVNLTGTLTNTGATLALTDTTGSWNLVGGTILGGTVSTTGQAQLVATGGPFASTSTLTGVTLAGQLTVEGATTNGGLTVTVRQGLTLDNGTVQLAGTSYGSDLATLLFDGPGPQTLGGTGQVVFAGPGFGNGAADVLQSDAGPLTVAAGVRVTDTTAGGVVGSPGQPLVLDGTVTAGAGRQITVTGSSVTNNGTIAADGGTVEVTNLQANAGGIAVTSNGTLDLEGSWQNAGTIADTSGALELGGSFTTAGLGTIDRSGGGVYLLGTLDNRNATLALDDATGSWDLDNGTIDGGTIATTGHAQLIATDFDTLTEVTLAGELTVQSNSVNGATVTVQQGLTLDNGTVQLAGGFSTQGAVYATLLLPGSGPQALSVAGGGTGEVLFSGAGVLASNGGPLTVPQDVSVVAMPGGGGVVGSPNEALTIDGTVTDRGGTPLTLVGSSVTNNGTIAADGGSTVTVQNVTNLAGGTLTGGTWQVTGNSTLELPGAAITTNAADVLLDGASARFDSDTAGTSALAPLAANAAGGSFTIQNGADFQSASDFTNAGTVTIGSGSTFTPGGAGVYTQTGGVTSLGSGTLGAPAGQVNLRGGTLSGPGTIDGDLVNAGAVDLGSSPGTLTIAGNYTQTAAGALSVKVGGTTAGSGYDQVNAGGQVSLGGTLNASLVNGFVPAAPQTFAVLTGAACAATSPRRTCRRAAAGRPSPSRPPRPA